MEQLHYINLDWRLRLKRKTMDTGMMKLSVCLLFLLPAFSSAGPLHIKSPDQTNASSLIPFANVSLEVEADRPMLNLIDVPVLTVAKLRRKRQLQSSTDVSNAGSTLEWVTFNNSIPEDAVSVYTEHVHRTDYVCKYKCEAGYYHPSYGNYCYYPQGKREYNGFPFEILVNKNSFEILEWTWGSEGRAPENSVRTCPGEDIFVGRDKYGLGAVSGQGRGFILPWRGKTYWYKHYDVLTINQNIISQEIYDVKYNTDTATIIKYPPTVIRETAISNYECQPLVKTDTVSKTSKVEKSWAIDFSVSLGVKTTFTAGIPLILSGSVQYSTEVSFDYSKGGTVEESVTDSVSVQITAPPNRACTLKMLQYKSKLSVQFTARVRRTYGNGEVHTMPISGMYDSVQVDEVKVVVDRCDLLPTTQPCTVNEIR